MYSATLVCGAVLVYEARSLVPSTGESVPCRRHGYCVVGEVGWSRRAAPRRRASTRAQRRGQEELLAWLGGRSATTVHALRRQRFTLRMLAAAERGGIVAVDLESGTVHVQAAALRRSGAQPAQAGSQGC